MEKEIKIKIVDIWSTVYTTCLKGHLKQVGNINGNKQIITDTIITAIWTLYNV